MENILGVIARGWGHKENEHKEMDSDLAKAIAEEVKMWADTLLDRLSLEKKPDKTFETTTMSMDKAVTWNIRNEGRDKAINELEALKSDIRKELEG